MSVEDQHVRLMRRALTLARKGVGRTSPNPAVGCVIVRDGVIVGEGWHRRAGTPHAEVHALRMAGDLARGADVYVTLEPCAHFGRTPPCADALVAAGVGRVFVAMVDPNPKVAGKGVAIIRKAGIAVTVGVCERESGLLNEPFVKHVTTGLPFVILKSALTLDGKTATASGDSRWITGERSRQMVHRLRDRVDAIMVGVGTVLADDPQLTVRHLRGRDPLRVVVDSGLRMPVDARMLAQASGAGTVIATTADGNDRGEALRCRGAELLVCRERDGRVDLADLLRKLGNRGVQSILLEGGATLAGEFVRQGLVDKVMFFYASKIVAGEGRGLFTGRGAEMMADAISLSDVTLARIGDDFLVTGYPEHRCLPA